jgi:hypothetical protein
MKNKIWNGYNWIKGLFINKEKSARLYPEHLFIVKYTETDIAITDFDKNNDSINWSEIEKIKIITNDSGPWGMDFWWILIGKNKVISIPQGATGESEIGTKFSQLNKFNHEELLKAVQSTKNAEYLCWEKRDE